jgi:hypothetical protein
MLVRLLGVMLVSAGCAGNVEPPVTITAVTPPAAYSDSTVSLVIEGGPFRPIYDVDTGGGNETIELGAFTAFLSPSAGGTPLAADALMWLSPSQLAANIPPGIAPGPYDVALRDPRGGLAERPMGFVSLGRDTTKPVVKIDEPQPGAIVEAGAEVPVAFEADDGLGTLDTLDWKVFSTEATIASGTCSHAPNVSHATCRFLFVAPQPTQPGEAIEVLVTATDSANNPGPAQTTLSIGVPPTAGPISPFAGPASGGTALTVRGGNFIAGTQVLLGDALLLPGGGTVVNGGLIQGLTPPHDPGQVTVTIQTGASTVSAGTFTFVGQPQVLAVAPSSGPLAGCTPITIVGKYFSEASKTRVWFGSDLATAAALQCTQYKSPNRIEGLTPPGAGAVSVFAQDPVGGVGELPLAYTYLDVDAPDGGAPSPGPAACPCDGGPP